MEVVRMGDVTNGAPLVEVRGISKSYGSVVALRDVSFKINAAEVVALAGDNGAGKSTVIKILSGIIAQDGGDIRIRGEKILLQQPGAAVRLGIQTVYQDLALCGNLDPVENIFLGREIRMEGWRGFRLKRPAMERTATDVLASVGIKLKNLNLPVATLSGGQQQAVAVCRAILGNPDVVILDEPTAALGVTQTREVLELVRRLRSQGRGVLMVSHDLEQLLGVADRIVVVRLGRTVAERPVEEWTEHSLVTAIAGAALPGVS
jgi:D-xylose transport system ATP-binding protein